MIPMPKGLRLLSLLLLATSTHAALDNQLIQSLEASRITLAGDIGAVAMYSVQADDDDDLEIFFTASSKIQKDSANTIKTYSDHWIILDRNAADTDYNIIARGELQGESKEYRSSYQVDYQKILLGHAGGLLSTIEFVDNPNSTQHTITSNSRLLSTFLPEEGFGADPDFVSISSIVSLTGTDQNEYVVLCAGFAHIYDDVEEVIKVSSEFTGIGVCQTGNADYQKIDGEFDEELLSSRGYIYGFDGSNFQRKHDIESFSLSKNFRFANIDDDPAYEILDQVGSNWAGVEYRSILNGSPWIELSATQNAFRTFYTVDLDGDGTDEILFDYIDTEEPHESKIVQVGWDTDLDSHIIQKEVVSPHLSIESIKYLPTTLINNTPGNFYFFTSSKTFITALDPLPDEATINPLDPLLARLNTDLTISWSGVTSVAVRNLETIARVQTGNTLSDFNLVQLEQTNLDGDEDYQFTYKKFDITNFDMVEVVAPDYADDEMMSVHVFSAFDFDEDGIDELHAGGQATYANPGGIVLSSNLDGTDHNRLEALFTDSVTDLIVGDINHSSTPDIFALGARNDGERGLFYMFHYDDTSTSSGIYEPPFFSFEFNKVIPLNVKGDNEPEILGISGFTIASGIRRNLYSYNPNAVPGESSFYQQSYQDLTNFTPVRLNNRIYDFALASSESGMLYLIEPKDMDILASVQACDEEFSIINNLRLGNNVDVAMAVCGQTLKAWVIEYDEAILHYGYELVELGAYDLGNMTTDEGQLTSLITDEGTSLIGLFKNQYIRLAVNTSSVDDEDNDGYLNYRDHFPLEATQWADADLDDMGDNQADGAILPDPSLNDIDNDGVLDDLDSDNIPENDLDPTNDIDHGYPSFIQTPLPTITAEFGTTLNLIAPVTTDIYDEFKGFGAPTATAQILGLSLQNKLGNDDLEIAGEFEANLTSGKHTINWQAQDVRGNSTSTSQEIWVYPSIAFETSSQHLGETQTAQVKLVLSGTSPEYPVTVNLSINGGNVSAADVTENINSLTVSFAEGETEKVIELSFIDDSLAESDESLIIEITDDFNSSPGNASWTVDTNQNTHTITVVDVNAAPTFVSNTINQNGTVTSTPNNVDGDITLTASFSDTNNLSYYWDLSSLNKGDALLQSVSFNPSALEPGVYIISVTATDDGLPSNAFQEFISLTLVYGDTDKDGINDNLDAFPNDASETKDSDGDGVGDKTDVFPNDKNETLDTDGDEVGDNADAFPTDATETKDSDGDGVGDKTDVFPNDKNETLDSDEDEVGDNADAFPNDASETKDTDGDGVGDNTDVFPTDKDETVDTDGDGVGDNGDDFPNDAAKSRKLDDQSLEDSGAGSLHYLLMLMLMTLTMYRRKA